PHCLSHHLSCAHRSPSPSPLSAPFLFTAAATTQIYTLSLHDALPISRTVVPSVGNSPNRVNPVCSLHSLTSVMEWREQTGFTLLDRKSTRLNSSHVKISYAVFCLKKKKNTYKHTTPQDAAGDVSDA